MSPHFYSWNPEPAIWIFSHFRFLFSMNGRGLLHGGRCVSRSPLQTKERVNVQPNICLPVVWLQPCSPQTVIIFVLLLACHPFPCSLFITVSQSHCCVTVIAFLSALFPLWQRFVRLAQVLVWSESWTLPAVQPPAEVRQKRKLKQRGWQRKRTGGCGGSQLWGKISFMLKERTWH